MQLLPEDTIFVMFHDVVLAIFTMKNGSRLADVLGSPMALHLRLIVYGLV